MDTPETTRDFDSCSGEGIEDLVDDGEDERGGLLVTPRYWGGLVVYR